MELKQEDYTFAKKIVDETLDIDNDKIESHIIDSVKSFISDIDTSRMENRKHIYYFLQHITTLYLNYCLNGYKHFLNQDKIEKCYKGIEIVSKIKQSFTENQNFNFDSIHIPICNNEQSNLPETSKNKFRYKKIIKYSLIVIISAIFGWVSGQILGFSIATFLGKIGVLDIFLNFLNTISLF